MEQRNKSSNIYQRINTGYKQSGKPTLLLFQPIFAHVPVPSTAVSEELKTEYRCRFHYFSVYYCTQNKYLSQYVRYAGQFQVFLQYRCFMLNIGFIFFSRNHKIQYSVFNYVWNVQNALKLQKKKKNPTNNNNKNNLLERCKELGNSCLKSTSRLSTSITWDYNKDSGKF